jgi:hypothetical protein
MRALIAVAILAGALTEVAVAPAEARNGFQSGEAMGHFAPASPERFAPRDHGRFRRSAPFGSFDEFSGADGFVGLDDPPPSDGAVSIPQGVTEATPPANAPIVGDLPPCRETTPIGVVIERGMACSRAPR